MAVLKKNQLNNILALMVDKDDFATVESGMAANDINIRLYGVAQGVSTAASTITVSKAATLVRSGLFQITLKASETDSHDHYMLRLSSTSTVSCATQYIPLEMVDNDDSDLQSLLSDIQSKIVAVSGITSDAHSAATQANSRILVVQSLVSDVDSQLLLNASVLSDVQSALDSQFTWTSNFLSGLSGLISDVDSQVLLNASLASDAHSAAAQANSRALVIQSRLSDVESALDSQFTWTSAFLSDMNSDLSSQIGDITVTLTVSDISDIASRVWSEKYAAHSLASSFGSLFSVIGTDADNAASRALVVQSRVSDVESALDSQFTWTSNFLSGLSGLISDVDSQVLLNASLASDAASAAAQANSRILVVQSRVSDIDSAMTSQYNALSDQISNAQSVLTAASHLSNIGSAVWAQKYTAHSAASTFGSLMSDIYSKAGAGDASDIASKVWTEAYSNYTTASTMGSKLGAINVGGTLTVSDISDIASRVWSEKYSTHSLASSFGSLFSLMATDADNAASRALINQSRISDVDSQLLLNASVISDVQSALDSQFTWISNFLSGLSGAVSDIDSQVLLNASLASDAHSAAAQANSRALVIQSRVSDIDSAMTSQYNALSDQISNAQSALQAASHLSNVASAVWAQKYTAHSAASTFGSLLSDIYSKAGAGDASDIASKVWTEAYSNYTTASTMGSKMGAINVGATLTVSDISDIASRVDTVLASRLSDILSAAQQVNSRALVIQSNVSDVESQLDLTASVVSDIDSQLTVTHSLVSDIDSQLLLNASLASDAHSAAAQANSRALVIQSRVSNVESQLDLTASLVSDIDSQLTVTHSLLSDVESAIDALFTTSITESYASDGSAFTPAQALYMIWAALSEFSISGTTITCKKLDGSTTAMTFTLDDSTTPTSRTRST